MKEANLRAHTYMISVQRITIYIAQVAPFPLLLSPLNARNNILRVVFLETNIKPLLRKKILNHFFDVWLNGGTYLPTRVWPTICFWLPLYSCWLWLARTSPPKLLWAPWNLPLLKMVWEWPPDPKGPGQLSFENIPRFGPKIGTIGTPGGSHGAKFFLQKCSHALLH